MNVVIIGFGLSMALGCSAFGGYVAEVAAGIEGGAGKFHENIIQRVAAAAKRALEFFASAKRSHLAQVHDRDAVTMALRFLKVMSSKEQGRAIIRTHINEIFPNRVACDRV